MDGWQQQNLQHWEVDWARMTSSFSSSLSMVSSVGDCMIGKTINNSTAVLKYCVL